jgi:ubiquinone biosynthesis UbiH/UbiF/VisC/COQ6 family hydroxylase
MKRVDIIISGGGMIGSIAAVAAIDAGLSVLLIEANKFRPLKQDAPLDLRVSAISWDNINTLKKLGIFECLLPDRIQAYSHMHIWDNRSQGDIEFSADFSQQACLGYLMENNNLVQAAWKKLQRSALCDCVQETTIKTLENHGSQVRVTLENGDNYKARLLIAAEGRQSAVRQKIGIKTTEKPYHQKGLVAYIQLDKAPSETALQAFNEGGPIGILPMKDKTFSIVWSLPDESCQHYLDCDEKTFVKELKCAIGKDLGNIKLLSQRAAFPLSQLYANTYFENRVVLCGDSAHGVHPLAGQGVNLGIGDIKLLFELVDIKTLKDDDLLRLALRKYQRRRISQVKETSEMMSFLHHLFKDDKHLKKPLRTIGLKLLNKSPLKKWFISQAGS